MMATSKSLKTAVKKEAKQAETEARTGDVVTKAQKGDLGPWREDQARLANTTDMPTATRRSHPPA